MLELGAKLVFAYLLGTLLGSLILGRLRGVDIRSMGSGNAGATNALRTQGKLFGLIVLVIDIAKGVIAVWWLPRDPSRNSINPRRSSLKRGSWLIALRSRGRGISTVKDGPSVAPGPAVSGTMRSAR